MGGNRRQVRSAPKKLLFVAATNVIGLAALVGAAEFAVRWRAEHGFRAAWRSFASGGVPFSDLGTGRQLISDPDLGYRWNPAQPGVNSLGLRHAEIAVPKPPGRRRVIVLGDSVAAPPDGFVGILQRDLQERAEVINAAVPGYTTYQERRLLERDLLATEPDLVLVQYCLNDNHRFLHRFDPADEMLMTEEARRVLLPPAGNWWDRVARRSYLAFRLRLAWLGRSTAKPEYPWEDQPDVAVAWQDESWAEFDSHIVAMRDRLYSRHARLMVVMVPYAPQLDPQVMARGPEAYIRKPQRKMREICERRGVPLLDLYPILLAQGGATLFYDRYHFTAAGHLAAAAAVREFLMANALI